MKEIAVRKLSDQFALSLISKRDCSSAQDEEIIKKSWAATEAWLKTQALRFSASDVNYLFVKTDNEIPKLVDFLNGKYRSKHQYSLKEVQILATKITSLERFRKDL